MLEEIDGYMKPIINWRMNVVAHRNLNYVLGKPILDKKTGSVVSLDPKIKYSIDKVIEWINIFLCIISLHFDEHTLDFSTSTRRGGANSLLYCLWELLPAGMWPPSDISGK